MKKSLFTIALVAISFLSFSQSEKFQKAMEQNITQFDAAKTAADFLSVGSNFERIAEAEKNQWLPYYYAALSNILIGFTDEKSDKDEIGNKADELIAKAETLEPKNSEIVLLRGMSATLHMMVDPMGRWQQYGMMQREAMETAKKLDASNPRTYYWEGQNLMNTPAQFGGGKDVAKPIFEKAVSLYKTFKPVNNLYPTWGKEITERLLAECSK